MLYCVCGLLTVQVPLLDARVGPKAGHDHTGAAIAAVSCTILFGSLGGLLSAHAL